MKVLVIDVGGSHVKILASGQTDVRRMDSGPTLTAATKVPVASRSPANSGDFERDFAFTRDVGLALLDVYPRIVRNRMME